MQKCRAKATPELHLPFAKHAFQAVLWPMTKLNSFLPIIKEVFALCRPETILKWVLKIVNGNTDILKYSSDSRETVSLTGMQCIAQDRQDLQNFQRAAANRHRTSIYR